MDQEQIWQKSPDHPARPEELHGGDWEVRRSFGQISLLRFSNFEQSLLLFLFRSVSSGTPLLIENLPEELDPVLDPLLGRWVIFLFWHPIRSIWQDVHQTRNGHQAGRQRGMTSTFHIPGKTTLQVEYNPTFKLFLHTKIANPHYKPELQVSQSQGGLVTVNFVYYQSQKLYQIIKTFQLNQYITSLLCMHNVHGYELYISMFTFPKDSDRYERVCTALSVNWNDISSLRNVNFGSDHHNQLKNINNSGSDHPD